MRRYIRHPSEIPIHVEVIDSSVDDVSQNMVNVGEGGLCFRSPFSVLPGEFVHISIPVDASPFEVDARVTWCQKVKGSYFIGVSFSDDRLAYHVRMVEQVCHIEQYRSEQKEQGRSLSANEAAKEWIERHAQNFPKH